MSQRQKVLDTESTTAKFLYAIIKQTDLKSIDWNRVASDLLISNGHAARMRYSRFRQQMEGTAAPRAKRKSKKAKVVDPPMETQNMFPMNQPGMVPTMMPTMPSTDSSSQSNPFIKSEPGTQSSSMPNQLHYGSQTMPEATMNRQQYYPQDYASMQFQQAISMQHGASQSNENAPDSSMNGWPAETMPTSYPYGMHANFGVQDLGMQAPYQRLPSSFTWGQQPSHMGDPVIKSEEMQQNTSPMNWEPFRSVPPHVATTAPEPQHQSISSSSAIYPLQSVPQDVPATMRENHNQNTAALSWEPQLMSRQTSPVIKNDEQQEAHLNLFWPDALSIPQDNPVPRNEEQQTRETITNWTSMPPSQQFSTPPNEDILRSFPGDTKVPLPPSPQASSPAKSETENLDKALVLWRPTAQYPSPSPSGTPATDLSNPRATDPLAVCHTDPTTQNSILVINIDENVPPREDIAIPPMGSQSVVVELDVS
ncbi:hypothetical protein MYU51_005767 [Penicillium brevicompactum]